MRIRNIAILLCFVLTPSIALSQDYCSVVLTEKAYDTESLATSTRIMRARHNELCSSEYNELQEFVNKAGAAGFKLKVGSFSLGANGGRSTATGKISVSDTAFCQADGENINDLFESDYVSQVASHAVRAWKECVAEARTNLLYIAYSVSDDGSLFSGTLQTTAVSGTIERYVTGISILGKARESVTCDIGGKRYRASEVATKRVELTATGTAIGCEKSVDENATITFQTSMGDTETIVLPSSRERAAARWQQLEENQELQSRQSAAEIAALQEQVQALNNMFEPVVLYQCPSDQSTDTELAWVSIGCLGQTGSAPYCDNLWWKPGVGPGNHRRDCQPVTFYKAK